MVKSRSLGCGHVEAAVWHAVIRQEHTALVMRPDGSVASDVAARAAQRGYDDCMSSKYFQESARERARLRVVEDASNAVLEAGHEQRADEEAQPSPVTAPPSDR
jgi:hypothetical protein